MRGHEQRDSGCEKNPAKGHGEKNGPPKSGAPFLPGFKSKNARRGLCVDQASFGPPVNPRFELRKLLQGFARPGVVPAHASNKYISSWRICGLATRVH
ncbi:MAG TPA: hypothetical protein VG033_08930 [Candidatus Acidoferrales bacterium]|nr:hypothetical protein [Candidatus Acidoferrales bacterium]